jgi:hypothetical protein
MRKKWRGESVERRRSCLPYRRVRASKRHYGAVIPADTGPLARRGMAKDVRQATTHLAS